MIGALGLGMIGVGVAFIWAGVKGRPLRDFFEQMRPGAAPSGPPVNPGLNPEAAGPIDPRWRDALRARIAADPVGGGDFG